MAMATTLFACCSWPGAAIWKILEVPVFYILRRHGTSKTGFWSVFKKYTAAVLRVRVYGV